VQGFDIERLKTLALEACASSHDDRLNLAIDRNSWQQNHHLARISGFKATPGTNSASPNYLKVPFRQSLLTEEELAVTVYLFKLPN
jgi:hypothetical protein